MAEVKVKFGTDGVGKVQSALQEIEGGVNKLSGSLANPKEALLGFAKTIPVFGGLVGVIMAAVGAIKAFGQGFQEAIEKAAKRQELIAQFAAFYGSVDKAKEKIKEFASFAYGTPFKTEEVAQGARVLDVLTNGLLSIRNGLKLVGDTAAGTNTGFEEVSKNIGRLYANLESGAPIERALKPLQMMGAIAPDTAAKIATMAEAGRPMTEIWSVVEADLQRFSGTMANMEDTWNGKMSRMQKAWDGLYRALGEPIIDILTPWVNTALENLENLKNNMGGLQIAIRAVGVVVGGFWLLFKTGADLVALPISVALEAVLSLGKALYQIAKGNLGEAVNIAEQSTRRMKAMVKETADDIQKNTDAFLKSLQGGNITEPKGTGKENKIVPGDDTEAIGKETARKEDQLAKAREERARKQLSDGQLINALQTKYNELLQQAAEYEKQAAEAKSQREKEVFRQKALDARIEAERLGTQMDEAEKKRQQDQKELEKKQDEAALKKLTPEEQVRTLQKQQKQLMDEAKTARESGDEHTASEKEKQALEAGEKADDLLQKDKESRERLKKAREQRAVDAMTSEEKKTYLGDREQRLRREAASLGGEDTEAGRKKLMEAEDTLRQLDTLSKTKPSRKEVAVDSLQRVGGGGGIGPITDPMLKQAEQQTRLLERIARAVEDDSKTTPVSVLAP